MRPLPSSAPSPNPFDRIAAGVKDLIPGSVRERLGNLIFDVNGDYRKSVFLAGTGRGGTTWVSALMNYDNRFRDMFEPFHSHFVRSSRRFIYPLYLRPDDSDRTYLVQARRVVRGKIRNWWVDQANRRRFVDMRLVKEVRANLWLKWLKTRFPELPIIMLLRHPCAVADSRMILEWPTRLQQFLTQTELMHDHLEPFRDEMLAAKAPFERHVFVWCIQHYVPLRQFATGDIHLAYYENFVTQPEAELGRLFRFLGQSFDYAAVEQLDKPSWTTSKDSAVRDGRQPSLIDSWRKRIAPADVKRAVEILSLFGLDRVYGEESAPRGS